MISEESDGEILVVVVLDRQSSKFSLTINIIVVLTN